VNHQQVAISKQKNIERRGNCYLLPYIERARKLLYIFCPQMFADFLLFQVYKSPKKKRLIEPQVI